MLNKLGSMKGYKLNAIDGELGEVEEFFFDDRHWTIRYLVADTGTWLTGKQVLISPYAVTQVIHNGKLMSVDLTKKQIQKSPPLASNLPVSQQFEDQYYGYYGWPMYWDGPYMWGSYPQLIRDRNQWKNPKTGAQSWDRHLRSSLEVAGYNIQALDGELGHVEDFVVDSETWAIRYLIVATKNWWPGKKVLVSPQWIERVSWSESKVFINLSRETIKQSPEYSEAALLTREYEDNLHRHYNRKSYWIDELAAV